MTRTLMTALAIVTMACGGGSDSPSAPTRTVPPPLGIPFSSTDLVVGGGAAAASGDTLSVDYTGWLYDSSLPENKGRLFDTSVGGAPFAFTLGAGRVIAGWDRGLVGLRVGGSRRLVIPPELAYGEAGAGGGLIPPNATLIFEVSLLSIGP